VTLIPPGPRAAPRAFAASWPALGSHCARYRRTGNPRAVEFLWGHTKIESTVRYLGIEIDDAIEIAEKIDV
jgi:hypothetical protein